MLKSTALMPRARMDGLVTSELDNEILVYDIERNKAHCLNQTAAFVWARCDGKTTVPEVAELLQKQLEVPVVIDVVWLALKQLQRFHLIEDSAVTLAAQPVSRRKLLLKYAPAALALPVIMSISAPTPAQAASCAPIGADCTTLPCCNPDFVSCVVGTCQEL